VIDVKGEYWPLAAALGRRTIRLEPGGEVRLNPIERRGDREGQLALLRSVALTALRRDLQSEEDATLRVALDQVNEEAGVFEPTLPMVVQPLLHPRQAMVAGVSGAGPPSSVAARAAALALQRLCDGDLRASVQAEVARGRHEARPAPSRGGRPAPPTRDLAGRSPQRSRLGRNRRILVGAGLRRAD
jgi:hypothetical protein